MTGARDAMLAPTILASLAVAAGLLVAHEVITRHAFGASVEAAARVEDALPRITRLAELRGCLRQVREAGLLAIVDLDRSARRSASALSRVRVHVRPATDDPALVGAVESVVAATHALAVAEGDPIAPATALVRATDHADRLAEGEIARTTALATRAALRVVGLEDRAATFSVILLGLFLLLFALLAMVTLRLLARAQRARALQLQELDTFAARVAHDLRDPLSPIDMAIELLQRDATLGDPARRLVERQRSALRRAYDLIDALLEFARAGGPPSRDATSDVPAVLQGVEASLTGTAERERATLAVHAQEGLKVPLPSAVLGTIVTNLAKNALLYLGDARDRLVTICATSRDDSVLLQVEDHGPGLAPGSLEGLFAPFVRGTSRSGGHGLGLATTKRLVEAYGGSIAVRSQVGSGSTFEVRLPLSHRPAEQASAAGWPSSPRGARTSSRPPGG